MREASLRTRLLYTLFLFLLALLAAFSPRGTRIERGSRTAAITLLEGPAS